MYIFNLITLLGGLAMFLYGMRLMSTNLKESSSGTLKVAMEKVTNNPLKAFLLGVLITAIIQSSTATIVITSGLVAAGIISLKQSLGIIIGANVGTTVTGQIIRLLDVDSSKTAWLEVFKPSTLAPLALILGIAFLMFCKFKKSDVVGSIAIGFGILFFGLMSMTNAVSSLTETGIIERIFLSLGDNPFLSYVAGAGIAFVLQSSSATIGILQAFSLSADIPFKVVYIALVGIYLGDCVTTAIVCSIGSKADARRVGIVNILFNLSETVVVLIAVSLVHNFGMLDNLWNASLTSGGIANTNTIFNLGCAILLLPLVGIYEKISRRIVKDEENINAKYSALANALNPVFFATPALAFRGCYDMLLAMFDASQENIKKALHALYEYDREEIDAIYAEEENIDRMADIVQNYMLKLSPHISEDLHIRIFDQYNKLVGEFEHLGDRAVNIAEIAESMNHSGIEFSEKALSELNVVNELLEKVMGYTKQSFLKRDVDAARCIEPLEQVMDDLINTLHDNHLIRLREGLCTIPSGMKFLEILNNIGRISDTCSNVGISTISRVNPKMADMAHSYVTMLHRDEQFVKEYEKLHETYFSKLCLEEK